MNRVKWVNLVNFMDGGEMSKLDDSCDHNCIETV